MMNDDTSRKENRSNSDPGGSDSPSEPPSSPPDAGTHSSNSAGTSPDHSDMVMVLGIVTVLIGSLKLLCGILIPFGFQYFSKDILEMLREMDVASPEKMSSILSIVIYLIVIAFLLIPGLLQIVGSVGVFKRRNWGRILLIVLGGLDALLALPQLLAGNPVGFLLSGGWGVFALYVLLSDPYKQEFMTNGLNRAS